MDDVRAVLAGERKWAVVCGDAVVWMMRLAWEFGPFAHATLCDPPYHLTSVSRGGSPRDNDEGTPFGRTRLGSKGFMGKTWDGGDVAHRVETWRAALMCSLPGAHLVAASGTRTYHRLAVAAEDAGWDVREMLGWLCAQGMAKTGDVSKRIDKMHGATREVVGVRDRYQDGRQRKIGDASDGGTFGGKSFTVNGVADVTAPATDDARQWEGWSESLAPSMEPMLLARKPFRGSTATNLLTHGCGALNIDAGRIAGTAQSGAGATGFGDGREDGYQLGTGRVYQTEGRWPKTIALVHNEGCRRVGTKRVTAGTAVNRNRDPEASNSWFGQRAPQTGEDQGYADENGEEIVDAWECDPSCAVAHLDAMAPDAMHRAGNRGGTSRGSMGYAGGATGDTMPRGYDDASVNVARFFFQAKASSSERWMLVTCGCGRRPMRRTAAKHLTERKDKTTFCTLCKQPARIVQHATVKPLDLDRWLARLVCVPGGVTLVPFCGSGSEMIAALEAGSRVVGFELESDHADIAVARLTAWEQGDRDDHDDPAAAVEALKPEGPRQRSLFDVMGGSR